ncbi:helicase HerA domain-containing protein [Desulfovibrio desulfuricans]|uniref:helicase HerA domain-containing protein n=1 Tax=Desulfovibrio desulfuricans TaxID=876 RepID=UPI001AE8F6BF|nr:DUF87 domain-containing protein [Desulfovibrio desulfuricans]QTO40865.1 DndE family protein [Desulfovibrio desulfuricans]
MSELTLTRIDRIRYQPTKVSDSFLGVLRSAIAAPDKATVARLAIARSLYEPAIPSALILPPNVEMGNAIEGVHLFGEDHEIWACLVCASVKNVVKEGKDFKALVEAHWHRGMQLLQDDYRDVKESDEAFVGRLASMVSSFGGITSGTSLNVLNEASGPATLHFGSQSVTYPAGEEIQFTLNAPGTSPHIAVLGKTRSGKSRTGLDMASELILARDLPFLLIDPKGEFVKDGQLIAKSEWGGETLRRFFPEIEPLDVPSTPIPLDFLWQSPNSAPHELARIASGFKDSFQKCIRAKGDVVLNTLRECVLELLREHTGPISLADVRERFVEHSEGKGGSIGAKLSELEALGVFEPTSPPSSFFSKRWVLSFGGCSDESKKLAIFLVLDALNSYMLSLADSAVDTNNHRALRHLMVIDEAREVLTYRHGALSSLIRKSASKGGVVMLLSQGPDDFDQEEDDFLEQMGTVGVFALSASNVKNLTGTFGKRMKVEDFADKSLPAGVALVKFSGRPQVKVLAWK